MAEVLDEFPPQRRGAPPRYPYNQWFNGDTWKLEHGVDFTTNIQHLRTGLGHAARKRGGILRTTISEDNKTLIIKYGEAPPRLHPNNK